MTKTDIGNPAFFICGTPSDKRGFEYAELGPESLPGNPGSYLDRRLATRKQVSYDIEIIAVGQSQAVMYAQSYPINPNDSEINRGAYLAVGFVCTTSPSLHTATDCIARAGAIAANLRAHLNSNNTLPKGFRLKEFRHEGLDRLDAQCSPLLRADLLLQAAHRTGRFARDDSFTFRDRDFPAEAHLSDYLVYTGADALAIEALEVERERVAQLIETAARAAALADNEQQNWRAFQQGAQRELESFVDRKADFDAMLEQLRKLSEATKAIAKSATAAPRPQKRTTRPGGDTNAAGRRPQQHAARIPNKPGTFGANSTLIAIAVASVVLLSTLLYFRSPPPEAAEPTTEPAPTIVETQESFVEPAFVDPQTMPDIVRERAALDGPAESIQADAQPES